MFVVELTSVYCIIFDIILSLCSVDNHYQLTFAKRDLIVKIQKIHGKL